jgi:hypothetical protein
MVDSVAGANFPFFNPEPLAGPVEVPLRAIDCPVLLLAGVLKGLDGRTEVSLDSTFVIFVILAGLVS